MTSSQNTIREQINGIVDNNTVLNDTIELKEAMIILLTDEIKKLRGKLERNNRTLSELRATLDGKIFIDFPNKLKSLSISSRIFELPFLQLEKWHRDAHQKLDQFAEYKRQEIQEKISEYQVEFTKRTNEQKQKIEILIKRLNNLSRQTQIASKEIKSLEEKIIETKTFFSSIEKHSIKLSTSAFLVNIRTHFFDCPTSTSPLPTQSRKARPELKEPDKHRFDHKKRSLSASLL